MATETLLKLAVVRVRWILYPPFLYLPVFATPLSRVLFTVAPATFPCVNE